MNTAQVQTNPASRWTSHHVTVRSAARVDLSHLGVHTHADMLRFDTGTLNVATMQAGAAASRFRNLRVVGHCRFSTAHAALPPDFQAFQKDVGPIPTYGPMNGRPGWSFHAVTQGGRNAVIFSVPTRFANWVAAQAPALRRRYRDPRSYSLEISWEARGGQ